MLASITHELQKHHEDMDAPFILFHLCKMFTTHARYKQYEVSKVLYRCKMAKGDQVNPHVIKMISYTERLASLDFIMKNDLAIDLVL